MDPVGTQTRKGQTTSKTGATTNQPLMATSTTNNSVNVAGLGLAKQIAVADSTAKAHEQQAEEKAKNLRKLGTLSETPREYTIFKKHENDLKSDNPFISNAAQRRIYHELNGPNAWYDIYSYSHDLNQFYIPPGSGLKSQQPKVKTQSFAEYAKEFKIAPKTSASPKSGNEYIKGDFLNGVSSKPVEKIALDANALIHALEGGELKTIDDAINGRTPIISITAAKEFLKYGDISILRKFLTDRGGVYWKSALGKRYSKPSESSKYSK